MINYLNGEFLPDEDTRIPISDRGLLYGDGFFETIRMHNGQPFRWKRHAERLERAHKALRIPFAIDLTTFHQVLEKLSRLNNQPESIARLHVTRGSGSRGYSPLRAGPPTVLVTTHPLGLQHFPEQIEFWTLITARSVRLPAPNLLSDFKHANRLLQIMARMEADDQGAGDALVLDHLGAVAETSSANLFWVRDETVHTPPLDTGALPGVMRSVVIELCMTAGLKLFETRIGPEGLAQVQSVFLSLSSRGIVAVSQVDASPIPCSPVTHQLHEAYQRQLELECPITAIS